MIRFNRRLERDIAERGRTPESVEKQYKKQVRPAYEQYIEPFKHNDNFTVIENNGKLIVELQQNEKIKEIIDEIKN
jgi:uridine kinase